MGQHNYIAIVYGILFEGPSVNDGGPAKFSDKLYGELGKLDVRKGKGPESSTYGIKTSYESKVDYLGLFVATSDYYLSKWWDCALFGNIVLSGLDETSMRKMYPKQLARAKKFWRTKVAPLLKEYGVTGTPGLHIIQDFD